MDSYKTTGAPDVFELKNGTCSCKNCVPPYSIKADGTMLTQTATYHVVATPASFTATSNRVAAGALFTARWPVITGK